MDNQSILLNDKWKHYFNWTIIYPTIFFALIFVIIFQFVIGSILTLGDPSHSHLSSGDIFGLATGLVGIFFIGFIFLILAMFVYLVWFIIASDILFTLLGINRLTGNLLNLAGLFIFGGISFLILPIYFWIKMRDHWNEKGQKYSWRAVALW
jgi:hypothetical protein